MLLSCLRSKMSGYFWNWRFCEALAKVLLTSLYSYIHPNIRGEPGWFLGSTLMLLISNTFFEKGIRPGFLPTAVLQRKWQKLVFRYYMFLITTQGNQNKTILTFFLIFYILYGNWWFKILHQIFFFLLKSCLFTLIASVWVLKIVNHCNCPLQYFAGWRMTESILISLWRYTSV